MPYFDSSGRPILLGKVLGQGGEGIVYALANQDEVAVKIYRNPIEDSRQRKIREMVQGCDDALRQIAAWPTDTVHNGGSGGSMCGFTMPSVTGHPVHTLYSTKDRKRDLPGRYWDFLVRTAQNLAAALSTVHAHGHVIGDVNESLVLVEGDGTVKLVDCDSFQIEAAHLFTCDVGKPEFTPPELQGGSFRGLRRTSDQDNFALAILIFRLLMMGRHPYDGVMHAGHDLTMTQRIQHFMYAYGPDARRQGIAPPPLGVAPAILPPPMTTLFERAFTRPVGSLTLRPTARDWHTALGDLFKSLSRCPHESAHRYFRDLASCPWCEFERKGLVLFVATQGRHDFDLAPVWEAILAVSSPGPAPAVVPPFSNGAPNPFQPSARPQPDHTRPVVQTYQQLENARRRYLELHTAWQQEADESAFIEIVQRLTQVREQYLDLEQAFAQVKPTLWGRRHHHQLQRFLATFLIGAQPIPGLGSARMATLVAHGIRTAADINPNDILELRGFGSGLAAKLMAWRRAVEQQFVVNLVPGGDPADLADLDNDYHRLRAILAQELRQGPAMLIASKQRIIAQRASLKLELDAAYGAFYQAKRDYDAGGGSR